MSEVWRELGRAALRRAKQVGTRAAAHGLKSVFQDSERLWRQGGRRLRNAIRTLEELTAVDEDELRKHSDERDD